MKPFESTQGRRILTLSGILEKWQDKEFTDFVNDDTALLKIKKYLKKHEEFRKSGCGMFLFGANGVGKTLLMTCAFKELIIQGYKVRIITLGTLVNLYVSAWYHKEDKAQFDAIVKETDFLGIEEIGKEYRSNGSDFGLTVLDSVVRYRVQANKPMWFTSNMTPSNIASSYSIDIASMLKEMCYILQVKGTDYRETIRDNIKRLL